MYRYLLHSDSGWTTSTTLKLCEGGNTPESVIISSTLLYAVIGRSGGAEAQVIL